MPGGAADPMNFVTVDELSVEIQKHTNSHILPGLLAQLRSKQIDLREFCKRVRMVLGAEVLINTVRGLQDSQHNSGRGAAPAPVPEAGGNGSAVAPSASPPPAGSDAPLASLEDAASGVIAEEGGGEMRLIGGVVELQRAPSGSLAPAAAAHAHGVGIPSTSSPTSAALEAARRAQQQKILGQPIGWQVQLPTLARQMSDSGMGPYGVPQATVLGCHQHRSVPRSQPQQSE